MNEKHKKTLDGLKEKTKRFFQENKDKSQKEIYSYTLVPHMHENLYIFATSKTEEFHCFIRISDVNVYGITVFDRQSNNLEELFKAAIKFSDDRNKLLKKWQQELKITQGVLKHAEVIYNWNDLEYMRSETRSLSKTKFTHPEFVPNYAEVSDIKWFLEHDNGENYFSLTYGHHYLLNVVVDTDKHIIGAIGTFKNTFLFEDYSASLDSLLEDSKLRFNEHWKLMYEANSQKERK